MLEFLNKLEEHQIYYRLNKIRDAIMVEITVPGQRWEVEFLRNGGVEVERFISSGEITSTVELDDLFNLFSD